jgi:hypothetical protein
MPSGADVEIAAVAVLGRAVEGPARSERARAPRPEPLDMGAVLLAPLDSSAPPRRSRRTARARGAGAKAAFLARRRGGAGRSRRRRGPRGRRCPWGRAPCGRRRRPCRRRRAGAARGRSPGRRRRRRARPGRGRGGDLGDRLDHADLVVDQHGGDEAGALVDALGGEVEVDEAVGPTRGGCRPRSPGAEPFDRVEHAGMFGGEGDDRRVGREAGGGALQRPVGASVAPEVK